MKKLKIKQIFLLATDFFYRYVINQILKQRVFCIFIFLHKSFPQGITIRKRNGGKELMVIILPNECYPINYV